MKRKFQSLLAIRVHSLFFVLSCALLAGVTMAAKIEADDVSKSNDNVLTLAGDPVPASLRATPVPISASTLPVEVFQAQ